ncbi:unnamed protein product [Didymodactylos carnosus]|uniref:Tetraspanin n=1 Tax=Didymodactylos carnosus TaxID=1234261 RepID=A0A814IHH6_9BILA|nr:unnamed protein product [Didymodactylos carnosus]CAF1023619.1 unnamed protein product [Didymodactylos carnosus]CAF3750984.1 unnamed protein product [Didymodactylos carnosus]CAF3794897.1 unnamed protein product [Didymodactylos carnosus]
MKGVVLYPSFAETIKIPRKEISISLGGIFAVLLLGSTITTVVYGSLTLVKFIHIPYNFGQFSIYAASIALIAIGGLLLFTLIFGIIGVSLHNGNLRLLTLVLAFLLFCALAIIGVWSMVLVKTNGLQLSINNDIIDLNKLYREKPNAAKKIDYLNENYQCCGAITDDKKELENVSGLPVSCCITPECKTKKVLEASDGIYQKGCIDSSYRSEKVDRVFILSIVSLACAGAVLLGLIFYGIVTKKAREGYATVNH